MKNKAIKFVCITITIVCTTIFCNAQTPNRTIGTKNKQDDTVMVSIKKEQIVKWLKTQITPATPIRNNMVNKILENAQFDKMYAEYSSINRKVLIVPLKKSHFSQHISKSGPMPFQNLFFKLGENGELGTGDIMLIYPTNKKLTELP